MLTLDLNPVNVQVLFERNLLTLFGVGRPVTVVNVVASVTHKPTVAIVGLVQPWVAQNVTCFALKTLVTAVSRPDLVARTYRH